MSKKSDLFNIFKMKPQKSTPNIVIPHDTSSSNSIIFSTVTNPVVQSHELSHDTMGPNDLGNIETGPFQPKLQTYPKAKEYWKKHAWYPVIDSIIVNMKHRFSQESLKLAISIDNFINLDYKQSDIFVNQYKTLLSINETDLKSEILVAKNCYENQLEKINNHQEHLKQLKDIVEKSVFPNLYKMLHLALSVPTSSASCERTISAMRRINTYLRSTMSPNRFSKLSIIAIERDLSNVLSKEDILNKFANTERRLNLKL